MCFISDIENIDFYGLKTTKFKIDNLITEINLSIQNNRKLVIYGYSLATLWFIKKYPDIYKYGNEANIILTDGHFYYLLLKLFKFQILDELSIPEFVMLILEIANENNYSVLLFGADEETNRKATDNLKKQYKNINVLKGINGYFEKENLKQIIKRINKQAPDFLLIGISSPLKEEIAIKFKNEINAKIIVPCGGMIDVLSNRSKKSPSWVKKIGLASVYRILQEPKRIGLRNLKIYYFFFISFLPKFLYHNILANKNKNILQIIHHSSFIR